MTKRDLIYATISCFIAMGFIVASAFTGDVWLLILGCFFGALEFYFFLR